MQTHRFQNVLVALLLGLVGSVAWAQTSVVHAPATSSAASQPAVSSFKLLPKYVTSSDFDIKELVGDAPANDSLQTRTEIEFMLILQTGRTPQEVARAESEASLTCEAFAEAIGPAFAFKSHPVTYDLLRQVKADADLVTGIAKRTFDRPRPYQLDSRIEPCVGKPGNASYPSGHTSVAYSWASVLAELFPEHREAIFTRAAQIGEDRSIAGVHYPSDVVAGRKLGLAIGKKIVASPAFQEDMKKARAELAEEKTPVAEQ